MAHQKKKSNCVKIVTFIFSRVGLSFLVIFYIVLGGIIFQQIESDYEKEEHERFKQVEKSTDILIEEIWNMTNSEMIFYDNKYLMNLRNKIFNHRENYLDALSKGYKPDETNEYWTITGAILYSVTLVTTIGKVL
jgi:hypothetical protein